MADKAERLHKMILNMIEAVPLLKRHHSSFQTVALWQMIDPLARELGWQGYGPLRDNFLAMCQGVRVEIAAVPLQKESVRQRWGERIDSIEAVFDANNFGVSIPDAFNRHFSDNNLAALDDISERLQAVGSVESPAETIEAAINAVRDIVATMEKSAGLNPSVGRILKHHLQQMEVVYSQVSDFGDDLFWRRYKETFASFVEMHHIISGLDNKAEVMTTINRAYSVLVTRGASVLAFGANVATIGTAIAPLLLTGTN